MLYRYSIILNENGLDWFYPIQPIKLIISTYFVLLLLLEALPFFGAALFLLFDGFVVFVVFDAIISPPILSNYMLSY